MWDTELVAGFHVPPFLEPEPQLGHLLIVARRHVDTWADLGPAEAAEIGTATATLARALRELTQAERLYSAVIGHHSAHFHLHLFPRYPGTPSDLDWLEADGWEGCPRGGAEPIAEFTQRLQNLIRHAQK